MSKGFVIKKTLLAVDIKIRVQVFTPTLILFEQFSKLSDFI